LVEVKIFVLVRLYFANIIIKYYISIHCIILRISENNTRQDGDLRIIGVDNGEEYNQWTKQNEVLLLMRACSEGP